MSAAKYDALSEPQRDRIEDLSGRYPATHFDLLEVRADRTAVMEHEDLNSAGTFLIAADGKLLSGFLLRVGPSPYEAAP